MYCPDKVTRKELTPYEQGVIVGQRDLIEHIKQKLKVETIEEEVR